MIKSKYSIALLCLMSILSQISNYNFAFNNPSYDYNWDIAIFLTPIGIISNYWGPLNDHRMALRMAYNQINSRIGIWDNGFLFLIVIIISIISLMGLSEFSKFKSPSRKNK